MCPRKKSPVVKVDTKPAPEEKSSSEEVKVDEQKDNAVNAEVVERKDEDNNVQEEVKPSWEDQLNDDEFIEKDGEKFVLLRGLRRLAHEKGYKHSVVDVVKPPASDDMISVIKVTYEWNDGQTDSSVADAGPHNCGGDFGKFPVAMAESRAEARVLRRTFNITKCSYEEISGSNSNAPTGLTDPQEAGIRAIVVRKAVGEVQLRKIVEEATGKIFGKQWSKIKDLSFDDGHKIMHKLNDM
jgi:hypothetical protein